MRDRLFSECAMGAKKDSIYYIEPKFKGKKWSKKDGLNTDKS